MPTVEIRRIKKFLVNASYFELSNPNCEFTTIDTSYM